MLGLLRRNDLLEFSVGLDLVSELVEQHDDLAKSLENDEGNGDGHNGLNKPQGDFGQAFHEISP